MSEKEFLRPADLAPVLAVGSRRVYQLIAAGVIPSVRVGGAIRIPYAAWTAWLSAKAAEAQASIGGKARSTRGAVAAEESKDVGVRSASDLEGPGRPASDEEGGLAAGDSPLGDR